LYEVLNGTQKLIDTNVQSYTRSSLGGINYIFDLSNSGTVKEFDGSRWAALTGSNMRVSQIAAGTGNLYMLAGNNGNNANVWRYSGSGTNWSQLTGSNINVAQIATLNGNLYVMGNNGGSSSSVLKYNGLGTSWSALTGSNTNVSQIEVANGGLFMLAGNNGNRDNVWQYSGSGTNWSQRTGSNTAVSQIAAVNDILYMVATNGGNNSVWQYRGSGTNWTALTGSNTQVYQVVVAESHLDMVATNGGSPTVWQYSGSGTNWTSLTGTALQHALATWSLGTSHPAAATAYSSVNGTLFGPNGPSYLDVSQGYLGDCWLLASLAETAARVPTDIKSMFLFDGSTVENGSQVNVYSVRFYDRNGVAHYVTVDTELPSGGTYYDRPVGGAINAVNGSASPVLWVALAEKAYAEADAEGFVTTHNDGTNSYAVMNDGDSDWALQAITGKSASDFSINPSNVVNAWNEGKLVVLCTSNPVSSYIVPGHCYAMVGYNASGSAPFEIFNPWGTDSSGWAPGNANTKYGLFWANAPFVSQNFNVESFGVGAAHNGPGAPMHESPTGLQPTNETFADMYGLDSISAELAAQLAMHRWTSDRDQLPHQTTDAVFAEWANRPGAPNGAALART
jgi:hypothetical protein